MDTAHLNGGQQKARALGPIRATNTTKRHATAVPTSVRPPAASANAPKITQIRWVELEICPPACRQASPSLSRRLLPAHHRRAEHSKLVAAGQRSALRRLWRAAHTCDMRCQGCVEPGATPMAIRSPARGSRVQQPSSVGVVVVVHSVGIH